MATEIYLPSSGAPPVSPAFGTAVFSSDVSQADRIAAVLTKGATALANKSITEAINEASSYVLLRQYVTPPLSTAYSFVGGVDTYRVVVRAMESDADAEATMYLYVRVLNGDGPDFRGTIISMRPSTTEFALGLTARGVAGGAVGNLEASIGDRLVIEFGCRVNTPDEVERTLSYNFGDAPATALDVGNTDTDEDYPFIEFSGDIVFESSGGDAGDYEGEVDLSLVPSTPFADLWNDILLKWCDEGKSSIGDVYLRGQDQPSFYLGLYTGTTEPADDDTVADLTEPSGDNGYARIALADGDWTETSQGTFTNLLKTFTCATSDWGDVYGWFITTAASGTDCDLITAEQFSDGPYHVHVEDTVNVLPKLSFT